MAETQKIWQKMSEMDERKSQMIYYASKYGTSEQIAHWLSEKLALHVQNLEETDSMNRDELPVLVLPMYAHSLYKSRKALALLQNAGLKKAIVVTVGLSDPKRPDTRAALQAAALHSFPDIETVIFSARGGMDYARLSKKDSMMMWMLKKMIEKHPEEGENADLLATYGQKIDLMSEKAVAEMAKEIEQLLQTDHSG